MALHDLVATCNYGTMEGEMIRDVICIRDSVLSAQLQLKMDLTLEQAKQAIIQ